MKKAITAAVSAVLLLSACGTAGETADTTTTTELVTTTTEYVLTEADKDFLFMEDLTSQYPAFVKTMGKAALIDLAKTLCTDIDNGTTIDDLTTMIIDAGLESVAGELGYTFGAAIRIYCPENQWFIDSL